MATELSIGEVAKLSGLNRKTIRFYEDEGLVPPPRRNASGYRSYTEAEALRLGLVSRLRLLGLDLPTIRGLLDKAFALDCTPFGEELKQAVDAQIEAVDARLSELQTLRGELSTLNGHIDHCCEGCDTEQTAAECSFCGVIQLPADSPTNPTKGGN